MTCIVGFVQKSNIYMGADSAGTSGSRIIDRVDAKLFTRGPMLFGFCGSYRIGQLLRYALTIPEHPSEMEVHEYLATRFVDAVRTCLKAGGAANKENEVESGGLFLLGYGGRLFHIESDYQVGERRELFDAVGSGGAIALGAMYSRPDTDPREVLRTALLAAERFDAYVRGPFHFIEKVSENLPDSEGVVAP